ncbi:MAG: N-terminal phage integrase SAM-like domain-containing protein, partial [Corallococcus sp.]|nr:N-terminal phage integrase SAM-like domain-containing protein [Corallococcus sp.]
MTGHYEQSEKSKLWSVRFRTIENGKETHKRLSGFRTKREAHEAYVKYANSHIGKTEKRDIIFDQLCGEYEEYLRTRQKESSYYENCNKINRMILPTFTKCKVVDITPLDILNWQNNLTEQGYSHKYKTSL